MKTTTLNYASADGKSTIRALLWEADEAQAACGEGKAAPRGIVQLVHGMSEHVERYAGFASYLVGQGFVVCANDHVGHGKSAPHEGELGHLPVKNGAEVLVGDVHTLRETVLARLAVEGFGAEAADGVAGDVGAHVDGPADAEAAGVESAVANCAEASTPVASANVPYIMFGHSMGSFVVRKYITEHADGLAAAIICGTGQTPHVLSLAGNALSKVIARAKSAYYRSGLLHSMADGAYAGAIKDARTNFDWLCNDEAVVDAYIADDYCGQMFTAGGYASLTALTAEVVSRKSAAKVPHDLPLLFIAGGQDPVGDCGRGVQKAVAEYRDAGVNTVDLRLYPGMRHEILNEPGRAQVMDDITTWLRQQGI